MCYCYGVASRLERVVLEDNLGRLTTGAARRAGVACLAPTKHLEVVGVITNAIFASAVDHGHHNAGVLHRPRDPHLEGGGRPETCGNRRHDRLTYAIERIIGPMAPSVAVTWPGHLGCFDRRSHVLVRGRKELSGVRTRGIEKAGHEVHDKQS